MNDLDTFIINQQQGAADMIRHYEGNPDLRSETFTETQNGDGSTLAATANIREWLPKIIWDYGINSMLDAPCGDLNWLQHVNLGEIEYFGWDVSPANLKLATNRCDQEWHSFECVNLLTIDRVPAVDLILCRDFLIHMPNDAITLLLDKFRASGSRYLITTHCPNATNDDDCPLDGGDRWMGYFDRVVNLERPPFNVTTKIVTTPDVLEYPMWTDKELGLFRLNDG